MYYVAICDDDEYDAKSVAQLVCRYLEQKCVAFELDVYSEPQTLLDALESGERGYHLLLLDILMRGLNGVELARKLRAFEVPADIIFITSSPDFALEGYHVQPIHYLLKPITEEKIKGALDVALSHFNDAPTLVVETQGGSYLIPIHDIIYLEVFNRTIYIHTKDKVVQCTGSLNNMQAKLPAQWFVRCHKSYLVNIEQIMGLKRYEITLRNQTTIPIGKMHYTALQAAFIGYIEKKSPSF